MSGQKPTVQLNDFQLRNVEIMARLLHHDVVDDEIMELLRDAELDFFTIADKIQILEEKVNIDEKTQLLRYRDSYLTHIVKAASRVLERSRKTTVYPVTLVRFDIDDFSIINNRFGHALGDDILKAVAACLKKNARPSDYVIRFGGEEFDVLMGGARTVKRYLKTVFEQVRALRFPAEGTTVTVTVSAGTSVREYHLTKRKVIDEDRLAADFQHLQERADDALYEAKALGKDRWCEYAPDREDEYAGIRHRYAAAKTS